MINETNKDLSKRFSFLKLIPWTRKRQCRQLGRKQFEQRLINLRSMSVIYGDKKLDETFFTTNWSNRQTESSTDIGTDKISSKWHTKVAQCPMMKKRTFSKKYSSKNLLGYVVSKFDKFADCFFDEKTVISPFNFGRKWKKNKQKLCQNKIMSSNWSFRLVKWSSVKFTEKVSKKIDNFLLKVRKWWEKNMFDRKKLYHKMLQWTDRKQFWRHQRELFVEMPEMKSIKFQWWAKKELFQKRNFFNRSP